MDTSRQHRPSSCTTHPQTTRPPREGSPRIDAAVGDAPRRAAAHASAFHGPRPPRSPRTDDATAFDVAVIGGGASGLAAAIAAARKGARACVIERDVEAGLGLLATGNGRCNISNAKLSTRRYLYPDAARDVLGTQPERDIAEFFEDLGLMLVEEDEGRLYPVTRRAESVRDVLLAACKRMGVEIICCADPVSIEVEGEADVGAPSNRGPNAAGAPNGPSPAAEPDGTRGDADANPQWTLTLSVPAAPLSYKRGRDAKAEVRNARKALAAADRIERALRAHALVLACGGSSARLCGMLGLPHLDEEPVLCPIACELACPRATISGREAALQNLDGLRVEAMLTLMRDGAAIAFEQGEVLFRPYGVSGIAAFNLSRRIEPGDLIELDLFPAMNEAALHRLLMRRAKAIGAFDGSNSWFDGLLARPLGTLVSRLLRGVEDPLARTATLLHHLPLRVMGKAETAQAHVRRGGIPLDAVNLSTLAIELGDHMRHPASHGGPMSHVDARSGNAPSTPPLFACGEALDMDADCGGYNLAWAWITGMRAGASAYSMSSLNR